MDSTPAALPPFNPADLLAAAILRLLTAPAPPGEPGVEGLSPKDLATFLGISVSQVYQLNTDGYLPSPHALGDGRCPRWSATEVRAWLLAGAPALSTWNQIRVQQIRHFARAG
jgi:predicted DNA-binding transcriptional regulator AlpA